MIFVYYSLSQKYFFEKKIIEVSESFLNEKIDNFNFFQFDAYESNEEEIVNLCSDAYFFNKKRVIIVKNAYFFDNFKSKLKKYDLLLNFLKKISKNVLLIFFVYEDTINKNNSFYKECDKNGAKIEFFEFSKWNDVVLQYLKEINVDSKVVNLLSERTKNNFAVLINEIEKLKLYNDKISINLAEKIISMPLEENFFIFFNCLINKKKNKTIVLLDDLIKNKKISSNVLLNMISNNLRFIYMCNFLLKHNNNFKNIANKLKSNELRVKIAIQNFKKIDNILSIMKKIYLINRKVRNGQIDCDLATELFVFDFIS